MDNQQPPLTFLQLVVCLLFWLLYDFSSDSYFGYFITFLYDSCFVLRKDGVKKVKAGVKGWISSGVWFTSKLFANSTHKFTPKCTPLFSITFTLAKKQWIKAESKIVKKREFFVRSCRLLHIVFKIFKFHIDQKCMIDFFKFITQQCIHLLKTSNFLL